MFPIIVTAGAPRDRGRQYGRLARDPIRHSIATYARLFAFCGMTWDQAQARAVCYRDVIAATSPALLEEIIGIAEGAASIAKIIFTVFIVLVAITFLLGITLFKKK